ncbi:glycoside hydrolase [Microstroma glucosiphilum]|uniref:Glycoside hydrolase n=1 Tax=Pseudomicrostroma glucosiphilum TaxID=1684307 RepID=A0A316U828_9BASI|nr:glycoside hydrolase [Pseudomicrostroma glucosiphilum]PWN21399.1 glycoside hydrolase [Pseudomicrostroma glucosiphilum]
MVRIATQSPLTGEDVPTHYLHASSAFFRDTSGRAVLLRGINLSGSSKAPVDRPTQLADGTLWREAEDGGKSFVGQPLNLQDGSADVHLTRLKMLGINCFRYVFTWEALEHQGPRKYDYEYMDYIVAVLRKCKEYGFRVYMDPHQDIFSRFSGGSGTPFWVLPACGIDHRAFAATSAAYLHSEWPSPEKPDPETIPKMLWATNYGRLAPATLSALFFASHDYAPRCRIDGKPLSEWLQDHFLAACRELAIRIKDAGGLFEDCVIGWDSMNEPNQTYIGLEDIKVIPQRWQLRQGPMPTPAQSMQLGIGRVQKVENWRFTSLGPKRDGSVTISPNGASVWLSPEDDGIHGGSKWGWQRDPDWPLGQCVWAAHGVWDSQTGEVLKPDYFLNYQGQRKVDFISDYWLPFWRRYKAAIRPIHKEAIMFVQPPVFEPPPEEMVAELDNRACLSSHFYDGLTLITKHWNWYNADAVGLFRGKYASLPLALRFGAKAVRKVIRDQIGYLRGDTLDVLGQYPTLIGEIGIPFDLDNRKAYYGDSKGKGKGDYSAQTAALDASLNGCDGKNLCNYTMWTYCPDHTHKWGDGWNGEDLSIWSEDDVDRQALADSWVANEAHSGDGQTIVGSARSSLDKPDLEGTGAAASSSVLTKASGEISPKALIAIYSGLRSAGAVSRPYPMATVGTPLEIDFDIKTSLFKYTVQVTAEDVGSADLPTEIYVPLLHYAADDELAQKCGRADVRRRRPAIAGASPSEVPRLPSLASFFGDEIQSAAASSSSSTRRNLLTDARLPSLALEVKVSSGRYEVQGQTLKWYLAHGEGSKGKQTIEIRRKGGAIKPKEGEKPGEGGMSYWCCIM